MSDPITAATVLGIIAGSIIEALVGKVSEPVIQAGLSKLKGDKAKSAFKIALGEAIQRYATSGTRFSLVRPLLDPKGPLCDRSVVEELAYVLHFDREPNYKLIGDRWKASVQDPPSWRDFNDEAKILVKYLREELQASEVFGPVFDSKSLNAINVNVADVVKALGTIEEELDDLHKMMNARFGDLMRSFAGASYDINNQIRDFTWYVDEKTRDFVGRKFVFDSLRDFIHKNPRGYFFVKSDPGIGKTALTAQWVKTEGSIHHFNNRLMGINRAEVFLKNICAQLIAYYKLDYVFLPPETTQDAGFLVRLLNEISERLKPHEKAVIVVDALDEVEDIGIPPGANLLYLPPTLPYGIYIFATSRRTDLRLRVECEQETLFIEQDSKDNIHDVKEFIEFKTERPGVMSYFNAQEIGREQFISRLVEKSQGNFMYLRYVLPEIESGVYKDLALDKLPAGLMDYYEDHWRRMRRLSENAWLEYKLPIIIALTIVKEPVSIDLIADFSKVQDRRRIRSVLNEWQQFLYEGKVEYEGGLQKRYRVYHDSFREFIASKDEVEEEHVSLKKAHGIIADTLWSELFGDSEPQ